MQFCNFFYSFPINFLGKTLLSSVSYVRLCGLPGRTERTLQCTLYLVSWWWIFGQNMMLEPGGSTSTCRYFPGREFSLLFFCEYWNWTGALVLSEPRLIRASPFCQRADLCTRSRQITNREGLEIIHAGSTMRFQICAPKIRFQSSCVLSLIV